MNQEWKGQKSHKWGPQKLHFRIPNQIELGNLVKTHPDPPQGKKHLKPTHSNYQQPRPKIRKHVPFQTNNIQFRKHLKTIHFIPTQKKSRPQKKHNFPTFIYTQKTSGIKCFQIKNVQSKNLQQLEDKMQRKGRSFYDQQRNFIPVKCLGDKPYKYPEYSDQFYKEGGLIPGSTIENRFRPDLKDLKCVRDKTKLLWKQRLKLQQKNQEDNVIKSLQQWNQKNLKQNNPNYKDPDKQLQLEIKKKVQPKKGSKIKQK